MCSGSILIYAHTSKFDINQLFYVFCNLLFNLIVILILNFYLCIRIYYLLIMRKQYKYKCMFSSINLLNGTLGYYTIYVIAYNIKEAMKSLRSQGYVLGKDFVYWKMQYNPKEELC